MGTKKNDILFVYVFLVLAELDSNGYGFWYASNEIEYVCFKCYFGFKEKLPIIYHFIFNGVFTWKMPSVDLCFPLAIGTCEISPFTLPWDVSLKEKIVNAIQRMLIFCLQIIFTKQHTFTNHIYKTIHIR